MRTWRDEIPELVLALRLCSFSSGVDSVVVSPLALVSLANIMRLLLWLLVIACYYGNSALLW